MSQRDVQEAVEHIAELIDEYGDFLANAYEAQTRYALIDPTLRALGWDPSDIEQVEVEYPTDWGPVDYALLSGPGKRPAIVLEAKALGKNLESAANQRQILSYAEGKGRGLAVLTDGKIWKVYDLSKRGRFLNKLVEEANLRAERPAPLARRFNQLLRRNLHWKANR